MWPSTALTPGYILISDVVKPTAAQAIAGLKRAGVRRTVMLTGDAEPVARAVASQLGIGEYRAGLLPRTKSPRWKPSLTKSSPGKTWPLWGDGINDAPVLSRADLGIAMGALGSDAAIEAADIVLMDDDPARIALAMDISRRTIRIVYQNIVFALAIKAACLVLGALGLAGMWLAIFADVGVMVLAVLNATRALYTRDLVRRNGLDKLSDIPFHLTQTAPKHFCPERFSFYNTMNNVPAAISTQPNRLLALAGSCKIRKASASVMTTLSLSTGTTLDASPICSAW